MFSHVDVTDMNTDELVVINHSRWHCLEVFHRWKIFREESEKQKDTTNSTCLRLVASDQSLNHFVCFRLTSTRKKTKSMNDKWSTSVAYPSTDKACCDFDLNTFVSSSSSLLSSSSFRRFSSIYLSIYVCLYLSHSVVLDRNNLADCFSMTSQAVS